VVKSPGSVATIEERGLPFKVIEARMGTRGLRRAESPGLRAAAGSDKRFFFSSKMWHSFSKCVKVSVSVLKVSVNVLYFQ